MKDIVKGTVRDKMHQTAAPMVRMNRRSWNDAPCAAVVTAGNVLQLHVSTARWSRPSVSYRKSAPSEENNFRKNFFIDKYRLEILELDNWPLSLSLTKKNPQLP